MGRGTEIAREVADVILVHDNLGSLVDAVSIGRTRYDDIKKAIHFIVSSNLSEVLVMFSSVALGMGSPLNPRQLLWINVLTDVFPELALAVEPPEPDVLATPPRKSSEQIFSHKELSSIGIEACLMTAASMAAYRIGVSKYGPGPQASSMAFLTLTSTQLLHTISSRSERHTIFDAARMPANGYVPVALGSGFAIELLSLIVPPVRRLLGSSPLRLLDLLVVGVAAGTHLLVNDAMKYIRIQSEKTKELERPPQPAPVAFETANYE
jgi:Ca2+-transporting ATPase